MKTFEIANAKINLYLDVSRKREDGYHDVTTLMHQISLCDELWIEAHESERTLIKLKVDGGGDDIPCDHRNLVYKAAELFLKRLGKSMNVEIHLLKNIPSMAGLGGGSSDAAATLRGLNRLLGFPFDDAVLETFAAELGSDTAFFIRNITALCSGRGEILTPFTSDLEGHLVLVEGKEPSSTKTAFSKIDELEKGIRKSPDFDHFSYSDVFNIFEEVISESCPSVKMHLAQLKQFDPLCVAMSGSGSAVFAIFETKDAAEFVAKKMTKCGSTAHVCSLL